MVRDPTERLEEDLKNLLEITLIESAESSNRIEGVIVADDSCCVGGFTGKGQNRGFLGTGRSAHWRKCDNKSKT